MWPFNKFKKSPFTHNPEDFKFSVVQSWFSKDYVEFEYTANGGKTWKHIHHAESPCLGSLDYDWEWKRLCYPLGNGDFSHQKQKFSSYQKILDFEKEEEEKYRTGQESIERQRRIREEKRLEAFKRANS